MKLRITRLAILSVISLGEVFGSTITPAPRGDSVPNIIVQTDDGRTTQLDELLRSNIHQPVVLLPLFTRCSLSCPTLLHKLEDSLAPVPTGRVGVLLFSFDSQETQASLSAFRSQSGISINWLLVRADEDSTRTLLQYLNYPVMSRGQVLVHPSELFVLDDSLRWKWTIAGADWTKDELSSVISRTESPGLASRLESHAEMMGWVAFGLALTGICLVLAFWAGDPGHRNTSRLVGPEQEPQVADELLEVSPRRAMDEAQL